MEHYIITVSVKRDGKKPITKDLRTPLPKEVISQLSSFSPQTLPKPLQHDLIRHIKLTNSEVGNDFIKIVRYIPESLC